MRVKDVMVTNVVTLHADQTVKHAARVMGEYGIGCLVILEDGGAVGMVTERDMLNRVIAVAADPEKTLVGQIMSKPVVTVEPDTMLEDAVELMFKHRIKKLPVVERSGVERKLVGLVTLTDIARLHPALMIPVPVSIARTGASRRSHSAVVIVHAEDDERDARADPGAPRG